MSKKKTKSQDAMDHVDNLGMGDYKRDKWLEASYVFEEEEPVSVDFLHKTKFGLWKEIDASNVGVKRDTDQYGQGRNLTCAFCNTSYNTRLREPKCPYCHRRP